MNIAYIANLQIDILLNLVTTIKKILISCKFYLKLKKIVRD